jgi:DNA polymerase-3 subunit delta
LKLPLRQFGRHLEQKLASCYLIAADEPLLVGEAADALRRAARREGFEERDVLTVDRGFRWDSLAGRSDNLSLFATRRLLEIRMSSPRPGDAGARALRELAEKPDADRLVIVTINAKLDAAALRSVWLKTIERHGVVVDIWPVERGELPRWVLDRARALGLRLSPAAAELMADRVEGNLLAADQELHKLALVADGAEIDEAAVLECVGANARFDVFRLSDAVLAGDGPRALAVLDGLRAEGIHPTLIAWAIIRELSLVARLGAAGRRGDAIDSALARLHVWRRRQPLLRRAVGRFSRQELARLLRQGRDVDRAIKGAGPGPAWPALTALVMAAVAPRSGWLAG